MSNASFVYVTYIRATPEKVWAALTDSEFMKEYWFGYHQDCTFKKGASWKMIRANGQVTDSGEVLEVDPPRRLVLKWRNELMPEAAADGPTTCTYLIEKLGEIVKLTVTHTADKPDHKLIPMVAGGWPQVMASLKSLIETGTALPRPDQQPKG